MAGTSFSLPDPPEQESGKQNRRTSPTVVLSTLSSSPGRKRILHVEFERTLLATRHALIESAGFELISCFNSLAAREVATKNAPFDIFLLGHAAPVQERSDLTAWMRANFAGIKVVALRSREVDEFAIGDIQIVADPEAVLAALIDLLGVS